MTSILLFYRRSRYTRDFFTCRRKTNRWTLNTFFYILDVIAYNGYVMFKIKFPQNFIKDSKRKRIGWLINLAHSLIKPLCRCSISSSEKNEFFVDSSFYR